MNNEEKNVIEKTKRIIKIFRTNNHLSEVIIKLDVDDIELLLNLIEKQQKEIEVLEEIQKRLK